MSSRLAWRDRDREDLRRRIRAYRWTIAVMAAILVAVIVTSSAPAVPRKSLRLELGPLGVDAANGERFGGSLPARVPDAIPAALDLVEDAGDPASLLSFGDAARLAGDVDTAKRAYVAIRSRFQTSVERGAATFWLGDMERDRQEYADAALWFEAYLRDPHRGPFSGEAQGRLMECLHRIGDQGGALRVAAAYYAAHPSGRHARRALAILRGNDPGE